MPVPVYTPPTKAIPVGKGGEPLIVHGLSFEDITAIVTDHMEDLTLALEKYQGSLRDSYSTRNKEAFVATLLTAFPPFACYVIALAADDPAAVDQVRKYPAGVQIAALVAVAELTLQDMGDLTDPSPALASTIRQLTGALADQMSKSRASSGAFDVMSAGSLQPGTLTSSDGRSPE